MVSVWKSLQTAQCRGCGAALSIGGDGRADNPGHSAKYGSYSIIDFDAIKIIHMELVQVKQYTNKTHDTILSRVTKYHLAATWTIQGPKIFRCYIIAS